MLPTVVIINLVSSFISLHGAAVTSLCAVYVCPLVRECARMGFFLVSLYNCVRSLQVNVRNIGILKLTTNRIFLAGCQENTVVLIGFFSSSVSFGDSVSCDSLYS